MNRWRLSTPTLMLLLVGVGAVVAVAGLHAVFVSWSFLWSALAGAVVAVGVGMVAIRRRLLVGESVAASVVALVLVGMIVCGGPSAFFTGLVDAWADLLSATEPADLDGPLRVVPLVLAWLGALIGVELVRWTRLPSLPAVGPLIGLALTALLSGEDRNVAIVQGATLATLALSMGVVQQRAMRRASELGGAHTEQRRRRRAGRMVAVLATVAAAAPFVGPRLPLADAHERYDLRKSTVPPWNPLDVPSPLVQLKGQLADTAAGQERFVVHADEPVERWQLAVLGDYDGLVWTVGSGGAAAAAEFRPVDTRLPPAPADTRDRPTVSAEVDVVDLDGPWLPSPGWPTAVTVDAPDPLRANLRTGTLALAGGVPAGLSYEINALLPLAPSDEELLTRSITSAVMSEEALAGLPPQVRNLAADLLEGQDFGWRQVMTVRDAFQGAGAFYDSSANVRPGHSYFRLAEFLADELRIVGYEEQYAAAAAVILRSAQIPARAVVGYELPAERWTDGTATAVAEDITAWVEVHVEDLGWVAVDVTPDRSRTPTAEEQGTVFEDVAVPNPPPPPPIPPNVEVLTDEDEEEEEEVTDDSVPDSTPGAEGAGWGAGRAVAAGAGALILLFVVLGGIVVLAKLTRRRTRRSALETADRVAGAWLELADRCMEAQVPLQQQATPKEAARAYLATEPSATAVGGDLLALVDEVDRAAYHRDPPRDEQADQAWKYCDRVVDALVSERSVGRRIVMRLDPRPLRHRDPIGGRRR